MNMTDKNIYKGFDKLGFLTSTDDFIQFTAALKYELISRAEKLSSDLMAMKSIKKKSKRMCISAKNNLKEAQLVVNKLIKKCEAHPILNQALSTLRNSIIKKTCTHCRRVLPIEFYIKKRLRLQKDNRMKLSHTKQCMICRYQDTRQKCSLTTTRGLWHAFHLDVKQILTKPCPFCQNVMQLECDHVPTLKTHRISDIMYWSYKAVSKLQREISQLRCFCCHNCHLRLTYALSECSGRRSKRKRELTNVEIKREQRRKNILEVNRHNNMLIKTGNPKALFYDEYSSMVTGGLGKCNRCGLKCTEHNFHSFDFNHLFPYRKQKKFSTILCSEGKPSTVKNNFKKETDTSGGAEQICNTCHRIETIRQFSL
tara:strand:+ start:3787 stop:4893 length:1107 start_codon:yes stop_codon:yes gene_type:complete